MTHRPESRMERRVRNQARGRLLVSIALLLACTTMTALFGWSLGRTGVDKFMFAMGLAAADLAGAFLIATSGTFSASIESAQHAGPSSPLACVACSRSPTSLGSSPRVGRG